MLASRIFKTRLGRIELVKAGDGYCPRSLITTIDKCFTSYPTKL